MKRLAITVGAIVIILFAGITGSFTFLDWYTNKHQTVVVPDLNGKKIEELNRMSAGMLKFRILDSIYDKSKPRGIVINQNPRPASLVKPGRTVYVTINKTIPQLLPVPPLIDESVDFGIEQLKNAGFKLGKVDTTDFEFPIIIGAYYQSEKLGSGTMLEEGSTIDLVIGRGTDVQMNDN